jgi:hypothetical protein
MSFGEMRTPFETDMNAARISFLLGSVDMALPTVQQGGRGGN